MVIKSYSINYDEASGDSDDDEVYEIVTGQENHNPEPHQEFPPKYLSRADIKALNKTCQEISKL